MIKCANVVKVINIALLGVIYFMIGTTISYFYSRYIFTNYNYEKTNIENIITLMIDIGVLTIMVYIIRSGIIYFERRPKYNFLNGICGFNSAHVYRINGGIMLTFSFLIYLASSIKRKVRLIKNNL
uniref:Uncharacterized protein n=1 Tax=viral metagenome TaxID=1070528 RepID=A0A6C0BYT5_9ZZZZ